VPVRQGDEHEVAGLTFDKRGNRGHALPEDEIAFPVPGHGPVVGLGWPFADAEHTAELALAVVGRMPPGPAIGLAAPQMGDELPAQRPSSLDVEALVDRLVGHAELRAIRERATQPTRDLLR
jgi:hypothetical protein